MNDQDIIRRGVELAPGWSITHIYDGEDWADLWNCDWSDEYPVVTFLIQDPTKSGHAGLDALAAELVRQVDETDHDIVFRCDGGTEILHKSRYVDRPKSVCVEYSDRTMNTIRAIVESRVLERG